MEVEVYYGYQNYLMRKKTDEPEVITDPQVLRLLEYRIFMLEVGGRKIFNTCFNTWAKIRFVHEIYLDRPRELKQIIDGVHKIYTLIGERTFALPAPPPPPVAKVLAGNRAEVVVRESPYNSAGVLIDDRSVDSARGVYGDTAEQDREYLRKKKDYEKIIY